MGSLFPKSMKDLIDSTRFFATARLRISNTPTLCALNGPNENEKEAKLYVIINLYINNKIINLYINNNDLQIR